MEINAKNIDIFYDLIDEACMIYYSELHLDYLNAFVEVADDIINQDDDFNLSDESIEKLNQIYNKIYDLQLLNEEIRLGITLLLIKGLKHKNAPLDIVTPDTIGYLYTFIIDLLIGKKEGKKVIIDTAMGISALSQTIVVNSEDIFLVGIEKDSDYVRVAKAFSDLLNNDVKLYYQDYKNFIYDVGDIVIGDLSRVEDKYEVILERLDNIKDNGYFIYLIDNDFFQNAVNGFKDSLSKVATLTGLIVLPDNFTVNDHVGKSILIGKKAELSDYHMSILKIDSFDSKSIGETFQKVKKMIIQMEG